MRTEQPLANLHRRLGVRHGPAGDAGASDPDPCGGLDGVAADLEPPAPSWVPDGQPPRGFAWLTAIRAEYPELEYSKLGHDLAYPAMLTFLPHGLLGLVVASLIAAYMSTNSTHLNWGSSRFGSAVYRRCC